MEVDIIRFPMKVKVVNGTDLDGQLGVLQRDGAHWDQTVRVEAALRGQVVVQEAGDQLVVLRLGLQCAAIINRHDIYQNLGIYMVKYAKIQPKSGFFA